MSESHTPGSGPGHRRRTKALWPAGVAAAFLALAVLLAPVLAGEDRVSAASGAAPECAPGVDFLGYSDALDKETSGGTAVGGLSGLTRAGRGAYYSVADNGPEEDSPARFYSLGIPVDRSGLGEPEVKGVSILRDAAGEPFDAQDFEGEGIAAERDGRVLISSETEPAIRRFSPEGTLLAELPVPERFLLAPRGGGRPSQTFESLALSPNARSLFAANEGHLVPDGEAADGSERVRILRYEDRGPSGFAPVEEFYYRTEPGQGVVELLATGERELLALERGFVPGEGNTVRLFRVSLRGAQDVSGEPTLAAPGLAPLEKEPLADLADCPASGARSPGDQANPLLDNYEAMTFGPRLPGGRKSLLLVSDDNFNETQVTRVLALGLRAR